jgi:hypothetical protein
MTRKILHIATLACAMALAANAGAGTDHSISRDLAVMARADIGGFNVGSKLAWQTYGAVGWQFNRHWSTELGYRYLSEDYANGGFVFKGVVSGAYLGITYKL